MSVSLSQSPTYQIPNQTFNITFSATSGNFVRVAVTVAPEGSAYNTDMVDQDVSELDIGTTATNVVWTGFQPDVAGAYTVKLYELQVGATDYGGYYQGDPDGYPTETIVSTSTATLYAGQRLDVPVGTDADIATLVLHVWDSNVRATTVEQHGVESPSLIDPATSKAETFAADSSVASALDDMVDKAAITIAGDPSSNLDDIITAFTAHLTQAGVHDANDTDNTPSSSLSGADNPDQIRQSVGEMLRLIRQHFDNDAGDGLGVGGAASPYHAVADRTNGPVAQQAADYAQATFAIADMRRAYEAHRVSTTFHNSADTTNTVSAFVTGSLLALYESVAEVLADPSPPAPATDNPGAVVLVHRGGMTRS
jgi:hypothetical protein